jgi:hypothetical protein
MQRVVYDPKTNEPLGYVQTIIGKKIYFDANEVAHFKLYSIAADELGVGLVEPLYKTIQIKMNIEEALGQSIYRIGFPIYVGKVGDKDNPPMASVVDELGNALNDISYKNAFAFPYYYDLKILESTGVEKLGEHLTYFVNQIIAGITVPKALLMGSGEGSNRATLDIENMNFERTLRALQSSISNMIETEIIPFIPGVKEDELIKIKWNELSPESLDQRAQRLGIYTKFGLLTPGKKLEEQIRRIENLPKMEDDVVAPLPASPENIPEPKVTTPLGNGEDQPEEKLEPAKNPMQGRTNKGVATRKKKVVE